jgi:hypothetical protein
MKIFFLFLMVILSSCSCLLSQIPPQKIYATKTSCSAPLPNYWVVLGAAITVSDNCEIASKTQVPATGFMLTPTNKVATVTLRATDASGNYRETSFTTTLIDTIKPVITIDPALITYQLNQIKDIYGMGDKLFGYLDENMATQYSLWTDTLPGFKEHLLSGDFHTKALVSVSFDKPDGTREHNFNFVDTIKTYIKIK